MPRKCLKGRDPLPLFTLLRQLSFIASSFTAGETLAAQTLKVQCLARGSRLVLRLRQLFLQL